MSEKLTLLTSSTPVKAQAIVTYIESSGISSYIHELCIDSSKNEYVTNIFVKDDDYTQAFQLLNKFHPEKTSSEVLSSDQQAFPGLLIVPVDFTPASDNACFYALELAARFHARVKLIHTYGIPDVGPFIMEEGEFYQSTLNTQFSEIREQIDKKLIELEHKLKNYIVSKSLPDIPIIKLMIYGILDEITLYSSEVDQASLIVIGLLGDNSVSYGSSSKIATRIIEKSNIPVLIIPEEHQFSGIENNKNILYLTTFDESDFSAIQKLITIVNNIDLKIFCLHIENGSINPWDQIKMNGLKEYFKSSYNLNNVICDIVSSDNMIQTLDQFIKKNKIEIITVINHKRGALAKLIHPGITKKILFYTRIPLFVFQDRLI